MPGLTLLWVDDAAAIANWTTLAGLNDNAICANQ
jgi:hypothetical protein